MENIKEINKNIDLLYEDIDSYKYIINEYDNIIKNNNTHILKNLYSLNKNYYIKKYDNKNLETKIKYYTCKFIIDTKNWSLEDSCSKKKINQKIKNIYEIYCNIKDYKNSIENNLNILKNLEQQIKEEKLNIKNITTSINNADTASINNADPTSINNADTASINNADTASINNADTTLINNADTTLINNANTRLINKTKMKNKSKKKLKKGSRGEENDMNFIINY